MLQRTIRSKYRPEYPGDFEFEYKDPNTLARFIMEGGKIIPSRISKMSLTQQRKVAAAVKKARNLALLPTGNEAYDRFSRSPDLVSPVPFDWKAEAKTDVNAETESKTETKAETTSTAD